MSSAAGEGIAQVEALKAQLAAAEKGREAEKKGREAAEKGREAAEKGREAEKKGREAAEAKIAAMETTKADADESVASRVLTRCVLGIRAYFKTAKNSGMSLGEALSLMGTIALKPPAVHIFYRAESALLNAGWDVAADKLRSMLADPASATMTRAVFSADKRPSSTPTGFDEQKHVHPVVQVLLAAAGDVAFNNESFKLWGEQPDSKPSKDTTRASLVDAAFIWDSSVSTFEVMTSGRLSASDLARSALPVECKQRMDTEKFKYQAMAQDAGWVFMSDLTYDRLESQVPVHGIISDGRSFFRVAFTRIPDKDVPSGLEPENHKKNFREIYDVELEGPVEFTIGDLDEDAPEAFAMLVQWLKEAAATMRGGAEPRDFAQHRDRYMPTVPIEGGAGFRIWDNVSATPQAGIFSGFVGDMPVLAKFMPERAWQRERHALAVLAAAGTCRHVPRIVTSGPVPPNYVVLNFNHMLATDVVGTSLDEFLLPLSEPDVLQLVHDIGTALEFLERAGVVHRDVKPGNVVWARPFTPDGRMVLIDFGLCALADETDPNEAPDPSNFAGTMQSASTPALSGYPPAANDDWESLAYTALLQSNDARGDAYRSWVAGMDDDSDSVAAGLMSDDADERKAALLERLDMLRGFVQSKTSVLRRTAHYERFRHALRVAEGCMDSFDERAAPAMRQSKSTTDVIGQRMAQTITRINDGRSKRT